MAYCRPQSVRAGDEVALHLSALTPTVSVEVVRDGLEPEVVWRRASVGAPALPIPDDAPEAGCGWPAAITIPVGASWRSGLYLVRIVPAGMSEAEPPTAFFVVRAATPSPDAIVLVLATTTWNGYNDVGGRNFYTGAVELSFERPLSVGMLAKPAGTGERVATMDAGTGAAAFMQYTARHGLAMWHGMAGWAAWERRFLRWTEAAGYRIDVATSLDLHRDPALLVPYRLHVSVGHDEYWSAAMRDAVERFVARGGHVAFFSGNTCYWQIRLEGAREVCFKHRFRDDPVQDTDRRASTTTIWSDPALARPENQLTGVSFTRGGYSRTALSVPAGSGGYEVHRPDHWIFDGTGLRRGDQLGAAPVVVGYECDGCELALVDGLPVATGTDGTPRTFEILATAPATPFDRRTTPLPLAPGAEYELEFHARTLLGDDGPASCDRLRHGHAVLGTYVRGGTVVTTGCTDWAYGLDDPAVSRITRNVLDRLGRGRGNAG
jgi:hypothetical protein